jgi:hypothetical protein
VHENGTARKELPFVAHVYRNGHDHISEKRIPLFFSFEVRFSHILEIRDQRLVANPAVQHHQTARSERERERERCSGSNPHMGTSYRQTTHWIDDHDPMHPAVKNPSMKLERAISIPVLCRKGDCSQPHQVRSALVVLPTSLHYHTPPTFFLNTSLSSVSHHFARFLFVSLFGVVSMIAPRNTSKLCPQTDEEWSALSHRSDHRFSPLALHKSS